MIVINSLNKNHLNSDQVQYHVMPIIDALT
jgi:hypothetical protein